MYESYYFSYITVIFLSYKKINDMPGMLLLTYDCMNMDTNKLK